MNRLFCSIARKDVDAHIVFESQDVIGFLDIRPIRPGHTQIIPKQHFETFDVTPPKIATQIMLVGQEIARALKTIHAVSRIAFVCTGGDVPHAHAHVVPLFSSKDITSSAYFSVDNVEFRPAPLVSQDNLKCMAETIRHQLG